MSPYQKEMIKKTEHEPNTQPKPEQNKGKQQTIQNPPTKNQNLLIHSIPSHLQTTTWPNKYTLNSNLHMSSLCSNPIVPEAATRYTDHYKLLTTPPHLHVVRTTPRHTSLHTVHTAQVRGHDPSLQMATTQRSGQL